MELFKNQKHHLLSIITFCIKIYSVCRNINYDGIILIGGFYYALFVKIVLFLYQGFLKQ